jgi:leucyl/phenylalanyl-tRNA---protein transferase
MNTLTADDLIYGYINGIFPMADDDGSLYWYAPDPLCPGQVAPAHPEQKPV